MSLTIGELIGLPTAAAVDAGEVVKFLGHWVFVPAMLCFLFAFTVFLTFQRSDNVEQQRSNFMGLLVGGICVTAVMVLDSLDMLRDASFLTGERKFTYFIIGTITGFGILAAADKFLTSKTRSFFIMPVSAASLISLYFYVVDEQYRDPLLLGLVGLLLGSALYAWLFSSVFAAVLGPRHDSVSSRNVNSARRR